MHNFDLAELQDEYNTKTMRVLLKRMVKKNPEFENLTVVTYEVSDTGTQRLQVCETRDEVRQIFLSPHCRDARTVQRGKDEEADQSDAA